MPTDWPACCGRWSRPLARVGRDVLACLHRADVVALMSTHARLMRVGDRSIRAIWDLEDLSG